MTWPIFARLWPIWWRHKVDFSSKIFDFPTLYGHGCPQFIIRFDLTYLGFKTIKLPVQRTQQKWIWKSGSWIRCDQSRNLVAFFCQKWSKTVFLTLIYAYFSEFWSLGRYYCVQLRAELNSNPSQTSKLAVASKLAELCPFNQFSNAPSHDQFWPQIWRKSGICRM